MFSKDWGWPFNKIADIDPKNRTITFAYDEASGLLNWRRDFLYAENLLEEIGVPGEYVLDRLTGKLYILPTTASYNARIAVSTLAQPTVKIDGTDFVTFNGIVFDRASAG